MIKSTNLQNLFLYLSQIIQVDKPTPRQNGSSESEFTKDTFLIHTQDIPQITQEQIDIEAKRIISGEKLDNLYHLVNKDLGKIERFPSEKQRNIRNSADTMTSVINDIAVRRAKYNLTEDPSVFNKYLSYRASIQDNPEKLKEYERLIKLIAEKTDIRLAKIVVLENEFDEHPKADPSTYYIFAAEVVELLHDQPDLIEEVLNREKKLKVRMKVWDGFTQAAYRTTNFIEMDNANFWYKLAFKPRRHNITLHEFTHAFESEPAGTDVNYFQDGLISKMKDIKEPDGTSMLDKFIKIREGLFGLTNYRNLSPSERDNKIKEKEIDSTTGLPSYVFSNDNDFLAESIRTFSDEPELFFTEGANPEAKELKVQLYNIYKQFFKHDSREIPKSHQP